MNKFYEDDTIYENYLSKFTDFTTKYAIIVMEILNLKWHSTSTVFIWAWLWLSLWLFANKNNASKITIYLLSLSVIETKLVRSKHKEIYLNKNGAAFHLSAILQDMPALRTWCPWRRWTPWVAWCSRSRRSRWHHPRRNIPHPFQKKLLF